MTETEGALPEATEPSTTEDDSAEAVPASSTEAVSVASTEAVSVASTDAVSAEAVPMSSPDAWRLVAVAGVFMELPSQYPEIVLQESEAPWRELRIPVGLAEGTAIAYAYKGIITPRPLTHQMFTEVIERHGVSIEAVRITARRRGIYHAELETTGRTGRQVVPCRPSDAFALVLRQRMPTPILVADWLFDSD
ncbi:MAG TPA: bifunctional nuclease family protein [Acidimicrobiales bacterium]|nr:bifunctional nuclease family protein [Acidimicrobiales bacterium]